MRIFISWLPFHFYPRQGKISATGTTKKKTKLRMRCFRRQILKKRFYAHIFFNRCKLLFLAPRKKTSTILRFRFWVWWVGQYWLRTISQLHWGRFGYQECESEIYITICLPPSSTQSSGSRKNSGIRTVSYRTVFLGCTNLSSHHNSYGQINQSNHASFMKLMLGYWWLQTKVNVHWL